MRVLVVDDDSLPRLVMADALRSEGYDVLEASDVPSARALMPDCDVAVIDLVLPGESGLILLAEAVGADRAALVVTAGTSADEQVEAMRRGAYDVLHKPVAPALLVHAVARAAERVRLGRENRRLVATLEGRAKDLEHQRSALVLELERRAELLRRAKVEWEDTFDAIRHPIVVLDPARRVVRSNRAFSAAARVPGEALPGRACHEAMFGMDAPCPSCPIRLAGEGGRLDRELDLGERVLRVRAFRADLGRGTHVVIYEDVTEHRRIAERLAQTERLAAIARLAAGVAHEINNPLASITANVRAVGATLGALGGHVDGDATLGADLADASAALRESAASAERVAEIVAALRLIAGEASSQLVPASVTASLERAERELVPVRPPGSAVRVAWDLRSTRRVVADPVRLDHACRELLKNAIQASPASATVTIRTVDEAGGVCVEIVDEGAGVPVELRGRVGEAFFTSKDVGAGRGLGLAVASGIVRQMGGELRLRSGAGRGTVAAFTLPAAPGDAARAHGPR